MSFLSTPEKTNNSLEQASRGADQAIRATQQAVNGAVDGAANSLQDLRNQTVPMLERAGDQASAMAHRGIDSLRETSHQLRLKAEHASESAVGYIKEEPVKAMLIAAATGAALMALISLFTAHRNHH
jgi:ElaB/YqjD/DUF883 family membrane-anchored ribosome-binding protein